MRVPLALLLAALAIPLWASEKKPATGNRLRDAQSRYLRQHADNPVDWYPWGDEAFARAKRENKPVFLSIGYSTCHWCHVMEDESFSDPEIAKLMNDAFVSIKVDREERPDLDAVYLAVTRTLTGDAGWPNNVVLTPDGKPFFAASYVPKEKFRALVPRLSSMWKDERDRVVGNAEMITRSLSSSSAPSGETATVAILERGYQQLASRFDAENGGFLPEPKFPAPHHLMFLLRWWQRSGDAKALEMVEKTLRSIRASALWDERDLGFHRYASDARWSEPHFEKMLYDQALLTLAYLEAYQATGKAEYAKTAREIVTYVLRDLRAPNGAFYAAQDADEAYYRAADRSKLPRPARDEKIIADWNGLMIAALAYGSVVLDEPEWAVAASRAAGVVVPKRRAFLDDYAFLTWGLLNLYEATFDVRHLQSAIALNAESLRLFRDPSGRFYVNANGAGPLLVRPRETGDGALPSGNSVQLMNLVRLARITADSSYERAAQELMRGTVDDVSLAPSTATHFLSAVSFALGPSFEIVLAGRDVSAMRRAVFTPFVPNKVVLHRPSDRSPILKIAPYTREQRAIRGLATAYLCTNYLCRMPVTDPAKVGEALRGR